jgi:hypothetical protein
VSSGTARATQRNPVSKKKKQKTKKQKKKQGKKRKGQAPCFSKHSIVSVIWQLQKTL